MLTARNTRTNRMVALPDFEGLADIEGLRELTRSGVLRCGVCGEELWLRAGTRRRAHFAHRKLADCPHADVSPAILDARRLLYRFFQDRVAARKLSGPVELEPSVPGLLEGTRVDLILRRDSKPAVAVMFLEAALKPDLRLALQWNLAESGCIFRPVFLSALLKPMEDSANEFLLSTTQRDLMHASPFGLAPGYWGTGDSLHFLDPEEERWVSLRGLHLIHAPQVFLAQSVRQSAMANLLWSESRAEWTHPDEPRAPKTRPPVQVPRMVAAPVSFTPVEEEHDAEVEEDDDDEEEEIHGPPRRFAPAVAVAPPRPPLRTSFKLVCAGCEALTSDWQTAVPGEERCVCKACFAKGVRYVPRNR